jgi:hypothetical protein
MKAPGARRVPVLVGEPLIGSDPHDYADAFEIRRRESDARLAEEFARCALEEAPWPVRGTVWIANAVAYASRTEHLAAVR